MGEWIVTASDATDSGFTAFSVQHVATLGVLLAMCLLAFHVARCTGEAPRRWMRGVLATLLLGYAASFYIEEWIAGALRLEYSLPLELCNVVLAASIISLVRPSQFATEIAYFWGFGGVLQATLTPDLSRGFPSWDFIMFFWSHGVSLIAIVFLVAIREFRPSRWAVFRMMIALNCYGLVIGFLDFLTGWNYGYLRHKPVQPSLLDLLGPWPWYLLSLEVIALLTFSLLLLPWKNTERLRTSGNL